MRRKCKRPLTFLLALLLLFSLTGASVQAEESGNAGTSVQVQTVVMQEDGTQKEDDVGATASTEENVQQEIPEINLTEIQQEEFQNGQNDNVEGEDTLQEKTNAETDQKETLQSDSTQNAENSSAEDAIKTTDSKSENRTGETVNNSDVENNASENAASVEPQAAGSVSITITDNIENAGTLNAQVTGNQPD